MAARPSTITAAAVILANSALSGSQCAALVSGVNSGRYARLTLPSPTDVCESNRLTPTERCDGTIKAGGGCVGNTLHHGPSTAVAILDNQCPILRLSRRTRHLLGN